MSCPLGKRDIIMKAMILDKIYNLKENKTPLMLADIPMPRFMENEILVKISACGVCHTELDEIEGRTPPPRFPIVLGHQAVGRVEAKGSAVKIFDIEDRVGIGWIYSSCGKCRFCLSGLENLCASFKATGRDANGGYAEYMTVSENFAYKIPEYFSDSEAAPLLCAGAIGYRSLILTGIKDGLKLGLTGFGASGHLALKTIKYLYPDAKTFVFARNEKEREFSIELGAFWAGDITDESPEKLDAIIDTTPVWYPVIESLKNLVPGGRLVINAIRKEDIDKKSFEKLDYTRHLWMEKEIKSVANVAKRDIIEFLDLAAKMKIKPEFTEFPLESANEALMELKMRKIRGAKVLRIA